MPKMYVSKLDAAKRQLDIAINLFFKNSDPISIHTLTAAAYEILAVIAKHENIQTIIKNNPLIKKEHQKEYHDCLVKAQNFFKHGSTDIKKTLDFNPEQTTFLLFDAVRIYVQLTEEKRPNMVAYNTWFCLKHPYILTEEEKRSYSKVGLKYDPSKRTQFFDLIELLNRVQNTL